jgi:hypothetical protein
MNQIGTLISELGGPTKVANALGCKPNVVGNWPSRGFIPWAWHDPLLDLARNRGVDITRDRLKQRIPKTRKKNSTQVKKRAA